MQGSHQYVQDLAKVSQFWSRRRHQVGREESESRFETFQKLLLRTVIEKISRGLNIDVSSSALNTLLLDSKPSTMSDIIARMPSETLYQVSNTALHAVRMFCLTKYRYINSQISNPQIPLNSACLVVEEAQTRSKSVMFPLITARRCWIGSPDIDALVIMRRLISANLQHLTCVSS